MAHRGRSSLETAAVHLAGAITELRELATGIHPTILTEAGLGPALESLAERAPLPVTVCAVPDRRLGDAVEAAAYFVVSECLANVAKHAHARAVVIDVRCDGGRLVVRIDDDGTGGADAARGSGLRGLGDRIAALDGRLVVDSPAGGGTHILVELPCA